MYLSARGIDRHFVRYLYRYYSVHHGILQARLRDCKQAALHMAPVIWPLSLSGCSGQDVPLVRVLDTLAGGERSRKYTKYQQSVMLKLHLFVVCGCILGLVEGFSVISAACYCNMACS